MVPRNAQDYRAWNRFSSKTKNHQVWKSRQEEHQRAFLEHSMPFMWRAGWSRSAVSLSCVNHSPILRLGLCDTCAVSSEETMSNLRSRIRRREERLVDAHLVCATCTSSAPADAIHCISLDCPWFYTRRKAEAETDVIPALEELLEGLEAKQEVEGPQPIEIHSHSLRYDSPTASDIYEESVWQVCLEQNSNLGTE